MQNYFELFKYGTLISFPLFGLIALLFISKVVKFSVFNNTFSQTILFLEHPISILIYRFNFLFKSTLDALFAIYVFGKFSISLFSFPATIILLAAVLFGMLALFTENKHKKLHSITVYSSGVLWAIGEIYLSQLTGDNAFKYFTYIITTIPLVLAFLFLAAKRTNVVIQIICYLIMYSWHIVFVIYYL